MCVIHQSYIMKYTNTTQPLPSITQGLCSQKPAGKKVKKRKRQRNQHKKETVTQPTVTQPMVTQQMVTQPGIVSEPVISTFNPDYFLNSVAQCQQGSLEGRSTRLQVLPLN